MDGGLLQGQRCEDGGLAAGMQAVRRSLGDALAAGHT